jgi:hypothetical protein
MVIGQRELGPVEGKSSIEGVRGAGAWDWRQVMFGAVFKLFWCKDEFRSLG